jgi:large subunit ribosomal protein L4
MPKKIETKEKKTTTAKAPAKSASLEAKVWNAEGKEVSKIKLPEEIFGLKWNGDLVHQVAVSYMSNKRTPVAHTKDRSEVRGGGKKPWQQKGTGKARHGSTRSPIWIGGGVTFGPRNEKNFEKKVNKKMRTKALFTVLSKKFSDGEVYFMDTVSVSLPKTKEARNVLTSMSKIDGLNNLLTKKKNSAALFLFGKDKDVERAFGNFSNIEVSDIRNISILDALNAKNLIITSPEESIKVMAAKNK